LPAPLTLRDHLARGSFRPARHARLLEQEPLGPEPPSGCDPDTWRALRHLQLDFCDAAGSRERRLLLEEFAGLARRLEAVARPPVSLEQDLAARIGLRARPYHEDEATDRAIRRRWLAWVEQHGPTFRAGRQCPHPPALEADETLRVMAADRRPRRLRPVRVRLGA
jgi:hypothetical protein